MDYNPYQKSIVKPLTNIIRVMQKIGFTISPDSTTISLEKIGETIDKIAQEFSTIW